jgi:hypothetical protein
LFNASFPFQGTVRNASDVLVMYTCAGDANFSGKVDGSDYALIDNGYARHLTGRYTGDFNYDGIIDGSDYTVIDNSCNNQRAAFPAAVSAAAMPAASRVATAAAAAVVAAESAATQRPPAAGFVPPSPAYPAVTPSAGFSTAPMAASLLEQLERKTAGAA